MRERLEALGNFAQIDVDETDLFEEEFTEDTTVADLLAWLERRAELGEQFTAIAWDSDGVTVRSVLANHEAFLDQRLAFVYALTAAGALGGSGTLSMNGATYGAVDTLLLDVKSADDVRIRTPDPQDLSYAQWNERMGGIEEADAAFLAWKKRVTKKKRR
jgi:hypothetical protein